MQFNVGSGPVRVQVLFFPVRVFPSSSGFRISGLVWVRTKILKNEPRPDQTGPGKNETLTGGENPDRIFFQTRTGPEKLKPGPEGKTWTGQNKTWTRTGPEHPCTKRDEESKGSKQEHLRTWT